MITATRPPAWRVRLLALAFAFLAALAVWALTGPPAATAAVNVGLEQCRNGTVAAPQQCIGAAWQTGNLGAQQAHYREGESVPFRMPITGLTLGTHTLVIQYDFTESSGKHAYDYLTTYNRSETDADPCTGSAICSGAATDTFPIPHDPKLDVAVPPVPQVAGVITAWNANITSVTYINQPNPLVAEGSQLTTSVQIVFEALSADVMLAWGGHVSSQIDWGSGDSAVNINGSPYHMRQIALDGSGGNLDRSMSAAAVLVPPGIATQVRKGTTSLGSNGSIQLGESVNDLATFSAVGQLATPTGTATFFVCGPSGSPPDCTTGGTQVGQAVTLVNGQAVSAEFTPSQTGNYCFRVQYVPAESAPYAAGNHTNLTTECFVVVPNPDVRVTKTGNGPISAGDTASFTILVENIGQGTANNVTLTDTLPPGVSWTENSASCSITAGVLSCNFGTLAPGASVSVVVSGTTDAADCGVLTNTATVAAANEPQSAQGNNQSTGTITVNCPNVTVAKTAVVGTISAGDTASFTIVVSNNGAGTAKGVTLTDTLPAGITWTENSADCSITAGVLSCSFGDLAPGQSRSVTVSGLTDAQDCGVLTNTATVAATNEPVSAQGDNSSTAQIGVNCADIRILKTADAATVSAGDPIGFTITVTNNGAGTASTVVVTDTLPTGSGLSWTINGGANAAECSIAAGVLTCNFGSMPTGTSKTVHVSSPTTSASCGVVNNLAQVSAANDGSAQSAAQVTVNCPNVTVLKTADSSPISAGDTAAFTIVVSNTGTGTAKGVTLSDTLPAGITWTEDSPDCSITSGVLSCSFGDLAPGATRTIHVSGTTDGADCGTLPNTATVAATNEPASAQSDNSSQASVVVQCSDVSVVKQAVSSVISAGDTASFQIVVAASGPGLAKNVTLNDPLPAGINWQITQQPQGNPCSIQSGTLSCSFGDLTAGAQRVIVIEGATEAADCGTLPNTATVSSTNEAPGAGANNSSQATITVDCPEIQITKTADAAVVDAGNPIGFTITVTNTGAGIARDVTVTDALPVGAGLAWSESPDNADCQIAAGTLTCSFGDLAANATRSVHVTSPTTTASCATYPNTAKATSSNTPVFEKTATATVQVVCQIDLAIAKTSDKQTYAPGETITYTITVTNTGKNPIPFDQIQVSDPAIGNLTAVGPATGTLAPGASRQYTGTRATSVANCGAVPNTATVTYTGPNGPETTTANNSATHTVTVAGAACNPPPPPPPVVAVLGAPQLAIDKRGPLAATAGQLVTYRITVRNRGQQNALNVVIRDTLPSGFTLARRARGASFRAGVITWRVGTLRPGQSRTVTLTVRIDRSASGRRCNASAARGSNVGQVRDAACTRIRAVAPAVEPAVTG